MTTIQGVIHGKTIELEREAGLPDGQAVSVNICPIAAAVVEANASPPPWWLEHLEVEPSVRPGKFVIKGTDVLADTLVDQLNAGQSEERLLQAHPHLSAQDLAAVREYGRLPLEMRRLFGAWAENSEELDSYLEWNRQQRKISRRRIED
jgi:uncharacterized protein (DUF433 family)